MSSLFSSCILLHFFSVEKESETRRKHENFNKKEDSNQLKAFGKIHWGHQLKILSFYPIAAPNDWVQDASPDVISSNASCTDLSQTLGLACCCHTDHLFPWIYVLKTKRSDELPHIHLQHFCKKGKDSVTGSIRNIIATDSLDF